MTKRDHKREIFFGQGLSCEANPTEQSPSLLQEKQTLAVHIISLLLSSLSLLSFIGCESEWKIFKKRAFVLDNSNVRCDRCQRSETQGQIPFPRQGENEEEEEEEARRSTVSFVALTVLC